LNEKIGIWETETNSKILDIDTYELDGDIYDTESDFCDPEGATVVAFDFEWTKMAASSQDRSIHVWGLRDRLSFYKLHHWIPTRSRAKPPP
jgi:hypothetical protein